MPGASSPANPPWLNRRRLQAQALVLVVCLWGVYAWVLATPGVLDRNHLVKGTDFIHFYAIGSLALEHRGDALYDIPAQTELLAQRVPEAGHVRYLPLYGPQVSLLFAPLAKLPYGYALILWWLATMAIYGSCVYAIWSICLHLQHEGALVALLAVAYPALFHLIAWGQSSALALACFTAAYLLLLSGHSFSAGLVLGCLAFKPQLAIVAAVVFLLAGAWKVIGGAVITASAQLLMGWVYYGTGTMLDYLHHLERIPQFTQLLEPRPYQTHCLRTFWEMLLPWPSVAFLLSIVSSLGVLAITFHCWRSSQPLSLRYAALLLATVLVSPHLTVYDLVILAPALLLIADWLVGHPDLRARRLMIGLAYAVYVLPLIGPAARWTHVQLSVIAMAGLLLVLGRAAAARSA
jgi:alpha-1,2-mannosyltransferase